MASIANGATRIDTYIAVTNFASHSNTLVWNGQTRTFKTNVTAVSTQIAVTNSAGWTATNLFNHLVSYPLVGANSIGLLTNTCVIVYGMPGTNYTAVASPWVGASNWAVVTFKTNVSVSAPPITLPYTTNEAAAWRNWQMSVLLSNLWTYATNSAPSNAVMFYRIMEVISNRVANLNGAATNATLSDPVLPGNAKLTGGKSMLFLNSLAGEDELKVSVADDALTTNTFVRFNWLWFPDIEEPYTEFFNQVRLRTNAPAGSIWQSTNINGAGDWSMPYYLPQTNATAYGFLAAYPSGVTLLDGGANSRATVCADNSDYGALIFTNLFAGTYAKLFGTVVVPQTIATRGDVGDLISAGNWTNNANLTFPAASVTTMAAGVNSLNTPSNHVIVLSGPAGAWSLVGAQNGWSGRTHMLRNGSAYGMTVVNESGLASAADRIWTPTANNTEIAAGQWFWLWYDGGASRWRLAFNGLATTVDTMSASNVIWLKPQWEDVAVQMFITGRTNSFLPDFAPVDSAGLIWGVGMVTGRVAFGSAQMPHGQAWTNSYFPDFYVQPHVHLSISNAPGAGATNVTFHIEYQWANIGGDYTAISGTTSNTIGILSGTTHALLSLGSITNNAAVSNLSSVLRLRLLRGIAPSNVFPGNVNVFIDSWDVHVPRMRYGSFNATSD